MIAGLELLFVGDGASVPSKMVMLQASAVVMLCERESRAGKRRKEVAHFAVDLEGLHLSVSLRYRPRKSIRRSTLSRTYETYALASRPNSVTQQLNGQDRYLMGKLRSAN